MVYIFTTNPNSIWIYPVYSRCSSKGAAMLIFLWSTLSIKFPKCKNVPILICWFQSANAYPYSMGKIPLFWELLVLHKGRSNIAPFVDQPIYTPWRPVCWFYFFNLSRIACIKFIYSGNSSGASRKNQWYCYFCGRPCVSYFQRAAFCSLLLSICHYLPIIYA